MLAKTDTIHHIGFRLFTCDHATAKDLSQIVLLDNAGQVPWPHKGASDLQFAQPTWLLTTASA